MGLQDDTLAIVELTARYNQVIDGGFADRVEEVFTPDARFSSPAHGIERQGTAEIAEMALGSSGHFVHVTTNNIITVDGDNAEQRCTLMLFALTPDGAATLSRVGWYDDQLVRAADGWRFTARAVSFPNM